MYTYDAGKTGLSAAMPPWVLDGGYESAYARLRDPDVRRRIATAIRTPSDDWENLFLAAGSADRIRLVEFRSDALKPLTGRTLAEAARLRGEDPIDTIMNLVLEDRSRVGAVYSIMSEENIRRQMALPWVSFGSDGASMAPVRPFVDSSAHPRSYGNFARVLGKVRARGEGAVAAGGDPEIERPCRRRTSNSRAAGSSEEGFYADLVVFDPQTIADRATYEQPHQFAIGVRHVFVNGVRVLADGEHTGALPGRALWGPGKVK